MKMVYNLKNPIKCLGFDEPIDKIEVNPQGREGHFAINKLYSLFNKCKVEALMMVEKLQQSSSEEITNRQTTEDLSPEELIKKRKKEIQKDKKKIEEEEKRNLLKLMEEVGTLYSLYEPFFQSLFNSGLLFALAHDKAKNISKEVYNSVSGEDINELCNEVIVHFLSGKAG